MLERAQTKFGDAQVWRCANNFEGGDISSDAGLLLIKEFVGHIGFATTDLYTQCETNGVSYAVRMKENPVLLQEAADLDCDLMESMKKDSISYAIRYGEFWYRAGSWARPRRGLCKVEKPAGQMILMHTFNITNMDVSPEMSIRFYCKRETMENFIKESKSGFVQ